MLTSELEPILAAVTFVTGALGSEQEGEREGV